MYQCGVEWVVVEERSLLTLRGTAACQISAQSPSLPPFLPPSLPPTGIEWFGKNKLVLFEDAEENTIEITSIFTFGYLWTKQSIITELDQVVYQQDTYHW